MRFLFNITIFQVWNLKFLRFVVSEENVGSVKCCERMLEKDADNFSDHKYGIHNFWTFFFINFVRIEQKYYQWKIYNFNIYSTFWIISEYFSNFPTNQTNIETRQNIKIFDPAFSSISILLLVSYSSRTKSITSPLLSKLH